MSDQPATLMPSHRSEPSSPSDSTHENKHTQLQTAIQADDVIDNLSEDERASLEKSLKKKLDWQIVPLCLLIYLASFLDRTNIGQARLNGLEKDLHMSKDGKDYRIALSALYVPYILFEIPSNLLVKKVGAARWIPFLIASWGLVSTLQGIVTTKTGLYINRAFLGFAEAGILPALALYLTFFYRREELGLRQALYFSGASLSGTFGGLLATAIGLIKHPLNGWAWIFVLEGVITVLFGIACFFILPNDISKLWWITPKERKLAYARMAPPITRASLDSEANTDVGANAEKRVAAVADEAAVEPTGRFVLREVLRTFTDPVVLLFAASGFAYAMLLYSNAFFSPTIIKSLGLAKSTAESQLLSVPPTAAAFFVSITSAFLSDRYRWRWISVVTLLVLSIAGVALAYASTVASQRYGGIILLSCGTYSIPPLGISWMLNNTAGHYKRATSIALYIVFTNGGGLCSAWLFNNVEAPRYKRGFLVNLSLNCVAVVLVTVAELYMIWETKARKAGKRDHRVNKLKELGWSDAKIREYLGDQHPEFEYML
ncbi:related to TNA1-high affinity nicotinic acid plasma membrane permease [Sporisorium reilianum f. sp. reilianum]|uniref:Related to TNA1-high affinity nicotinic acid plasma membrane permease n=1 Tax=Sporisorium reilianum f. sp. reilianum TaxID=72559 RepID=A0A2N8UBE7_9BASI|nr:related to TNA1-high affinity nicotinic acid plasma membrane permease [Sporisorium reilianum f. sp. reilianum]